MWEQRSSLQRLWPARVRDATKIHTAGYDASHEISAIWGSVPSSALDAASATVSACIVAATSSLATPSAVTIV